jgi:hypothetical protein
MLSSVFCSAADPDPNGSLNSVQEGQMSQPTPKKEKDESALNVLSLYEILLELGFPLYSSKQPNITLQFL